MPKLEPTNECRSLASFAVCPTAHMLIYRAYHLTLGQEVTFRPMLGAAHVGVSLSAPLTVPRQTNSDRFVMVDGMTVG